MQSIALLHESPLHTEAAARLLSAQWPRSIEARMRTLTEPPDAASGLPCSLVLLQSAGGAGGDGPVVVAHARMLPVAGGGAALVESVVCDAALTPAPLKAVLALSNGFLFGNRQQQDAQRAQAPAASGVDGGSSCGGCARSARLHILQACTDQAHAHERQQRAVRPGAQGDKRQPAARDVSTQHSPTACRRGAPAHEACTLRCSMRPRI
jgi:hypothetical protein